MKKYILQLFLILGIISSGSSQNLFSYVSEGENCTAYGCFEPKLVGTQIKMGQFSSMYWAESGYSDGATALNDVLAFLDACGCNECSTGTDNFIYEYLSQGEECILYGCPDPKLVGNKISIRPFSPFYWQENGFATGEDALEDILSFLKETGCKGCAGGDEIDGIIGNETDVLSIETDSILTLTHGDGTPADEVNIKPIIRECIEDNVPEPVVSTLSEPVDNGEGTETYTYTNELGETRTFCTIKKDLAPIFAVDFTEPLQTDCSGSFQLGEGGDTQCIYGTTYYTLTTIPDGYLATVDALSGVVTYWKDSSCGDCDCETDILTFEYDLVSQCGTVPAEHVVPIEVPPTGELQTSKEMSFILDADGLPTAVQIAICAINVGVDGDLVEFELTDQLDPSCFTAPTTTNPDVTIAGNTVTFAQSGITLAPGTQVCASYLVDIVADKPTYANIVFGTATDESGNDSEHASPDVLPNVPKPIVEIIAGEVYYEEGTFSFDESFVKTDGSNPPCELSYIKKFYKKSDDSLISEVTGTICNDDDVWTGNGIGDISPFLIGGTGNGLPFEIDKREAAFTFGLNGLNADDWYYTLQYGGGVGGGLDADCPIPSNVATAELCKVETVGGDNQSFNILSDDGTTTIFQPYNQPYGGTNPEGDILGSIQSAPTCAVRTRTVAGVTFYDIVNEAPNHVLSIDQIIYQDGTIDGPGLNYQILDEPNPPSLYWLYDSREIFPAFSAIMNGVNLTSVAPGFASSVEDGNLSAYMFAHSICGSSKLPKQVSFISTCNPDFPIRVTFVVNNYNTY